MAINTPPYGDSKDYPRNNRSAKVVFFSIIKCDWTPARPLFYIYLTFAGRFMTCGGASGVAPSMLRWLPGMLPRPWCKSPVTAWPDGSGVNKHYQHDGRRAHPGNALWHKHLNRHAGMSCNTGHTAVRNGPFRSAIWPARPGRPQVVNKQDGQPLRPKSAGTSPHLFVSHFIMGVV